MTTGPITVEVKPPTLDDILQRNLRDWCGGVVDVSRELGLDIDGHDIGSLLALAKVKARELTEQNARLSHQVQSMVDQLARASR